MTKPNRAGNYVDVVCNIRQVESIIEFLQDIVRQWKNYNDFEKLDLWADLQLDDWLRLINQSRRDQPHAGGCHRPENGTSKKPR